MKILIDMNLSPMWVSFLADSGFDSIHWSRLGHPSVPDSEIMDFAAANGFVIFTHDLDCGALLAHRGACQPSVIQVRAQDILPAAIGGVVLRALRASGAQLAAGAVSHRRSAARTDSSPTSVA